MKNISIFIIIIFLSCGFVNLMAQDQFLDNLLNTGIKLKINISEAVSIGYAKLGYLKIAIDLLKSKNDESIFYLTQNYLEFRENVSMNSLEEIQAIYNSFQVHEYKLQGLIDLLERYIQIGNINKIDELAAASQRILSELKKKEDIDSDAISSNYLYYCPKLYFLIYPLEIRKAYEWLISEYEATVDNISNTEIQYLFYIATLRKYIENGNAQNQVHWIDKIKFSFNSWTGGEHEILDLLELVLAAGDKAFADTIIDKIMHKEKPSTYFSNLSDYSLEQIINHFLTNNSNHIELISRLSKLGNKGINSLVNLGHFQLAEEIIQGLSVAYSKMEALNIYYFSIGAKILYSETSLWKINFIIKLALRIQDMNLRIELLAREAVWLSDLGYRNEALTIFHEIISMNTPIGSPIRIDRGRQKLLCRLLWENDFIDLALPLINKEKDPFLSSELLFKLGEFYISICSANKAGQLLDRFQYPSLFKSLLQSKIASWYWCRGDHSKAIDLFMNAFMTLLQSKDGEINNIPGISPERYIHYIIDDYVRAMVWNRIDTTKFDEVTVK